VIPARCLQTGFGGPSIESFEAGSFSAADFTHSAHVYVAWSYLKLHDLPETLRRFTAALTRFTRDIGQAGKYHETITWFFIILVAARRRGPAADDWFAFERENPDLMQQGGKLLRDYYSQDTLDSELAKHQFVLPDFPGP
jgi:hypothetical protein